MLRFLTTRSKRPTPTPEEAYEAVRQQILKAAGRKLAVRTLDLSNLGLTALPSEIGLLKKLRHLNLANNQLTTLPTEIGELTALISLSVRGNKLTALPPEIGLLSALLQLDLHGNQLTALPLEIWQLGAIKFLTDNPLVTFQGGSHPKDLPSPATPGAPEPDDENLLGQSAEQRPAAYRFGLRQGRIDIVPELAEAIDASFALDTYQELLAKTRALHDRLIQTNSARRVCASIERLLDALGTQFDDLRPGVLLSRSRSIEADRAAFDNEQVRDELFPDAIATLDDTLQSLRDLLGVFPIVRRIEAERLALEIDRSAEAILAIRQEMGAITAAAAESGAATEEAIGALKQNDPAIEEAADPVLRTGLIADQLLVLRNFGGAVIGGISRELGEVGGKSWEAFKTEFPKGVGAAARAAPFIALVTLAGFIAGPAAGIASAVPAFRPIANALRKLGREPRPPKRR